MGWVVPAHCMFALFMFLCKIFPILFSFNKLVPGDLLKVPLFRLVGIGRQFRRDDFSFSGGQLLIRRLAPLSHPSVECKAT